MNILITGATSGIGFELAKCYQEAGEHRLVLIGRKSLQDLSDPLFTQNNYVQLDLSQSFAVSQKEVSQKSEQLTILEAFFQTQKIESLDLVIHNAGIALYGPSHLHASEALTTLLNTNLKAPIALSHYLLPFVQTSKGKLVFISSVAAHLATADYVEYIASKAALEGFARSLRAEKDVRVQIIRPGATQTDIFAKAGISSEQVNPSSFSSAAQVAKAIHKSIQSSDLDTTIQLSNKILSFIGRFFAPLLDRLLIRIAKNKNPTIN